MESLSYKILFSLIAFHVVNINLMIIAKKRRHNAGLMGHDKNMALTS